MGQSYPQTERAETAASTTASSDNSGDIRPARDAGLTNPTAIAEASCDLETALALPERVRIDAPEVAGSINPVGARVDDIVLKTHRQTVDKDSGPVRLFSPSGTPAQQ